MNHFKKKKVLNQENSISINASYLLVKTIFYNRKKLCYNNT